MGKQYEIIPRGTQKIFDPCTSALLKRIEEELNLENRRYVLESVLMSSIAYQTKTKEEF